MPTALITGANRGLGLEFTRQYSAEGWHIIACCRYPESSDELKALADKQGNITLEELDVGDHSAIDALSHRYKQTPIDLLLNNAGLIGPLPYFENMDKQHFGTMDYDVWEKVSRINTHGPIKIAEAFVEQVAMSEQKKIVSISSTVGSISEGDIPSITYSSSKTALNKAMRLVAKALAPREITVAMLCPGHVKTRMGPAAEIEAEDSIKGMRQIIEGLTLEQTGSFTRYNGEAIAW